MTLNVTAFGSCRVVTPCQILDGRGIIKLNQQNIFGFTHYAGELFQQFRFISGDLVAPSRLLPYLNIPKHWTFPEPSELGSFHEKFKDTDVFVVEISSIRRVLFKAFMLQVNRTRELLVTQERDLKEWWNPLTRFGINDVSKIPEELTGTAREIATGLKIEEQELSSISRDIQKIVRFLNKPTVLVSHFDTDRDRRPIPQRTKIIRAMRSLRDPVVVFDPTELVLRAGIEDALLDLGHYTKPFEHKISECISGSVLDAHKRFSEAS